jgi:hypothetical protein
MGAGELPKMRRGGVVGAVSQISRQMNLSEGNDETRSML